MYSSQPQAHSATPATKNQLNSSCIGEDFALGSDEAIHKARFGKTQLSNGGSFPNEGFHGPNDHILYFSTRFFGSVENIATLQQNHCWQDERLEQYVS